MAQFFTSLITIKYFVGVVKEPDLLETYIHCAGYFLIIGRDRSAFKLVCKERIICMLLFMSGIQLAKLYKQLKYHCSGRPAIFTGHQASFNESIELIVPSSIKL